MNSPTKPHNPGNPPRRVQWGPLSTDEMGALWLEVVPKNAGDAALLERDYEQRAIAADLASAELAVRARPDDAAALNRLATKYRELLGHDRSVEDVDPASRRLGDLRVVRDQQDGVAVSVQVLEELQDAIELGFELPGVHSSPGGHDGRRPSRMSLSRVMCGRL